LETVRDRISVKY